MQIPHHLTSLIIEALTQAQADKHLPIFAPPDIRVEQPRQAAHGDYATPAALEMAKLAKMAPLKIAHILVDHLPTYEHIDQIDILPPGFINFKLAASYLQQLVVEILQNPAQFGTLTLGHGKRVQVEFVSANPTGPITLGRTRGGVIGDTLANVLTAAGYAVTREYYYNDAGRQIILLGESVQRRYQQLLGQSVDLDGEHYQGDYITEIAHMLIEDQGKGLLAAATNIFSDYAKSLIMDWQRQSLKRINIVHDVYYNENELYTNGRLTEALETLHQNGHVYQTEDGAQWFRTTTFGDAKDRVLIRSIDGRPTYRLPDIAYHWHKAQRGFDFVIDIFGPDHHALAPQVLMGVRALGYDTDFVHTLLHQMVSLIKDGQVVKMSTRRGIYVTLDALIETVGPDAIRYFMLARSSNSPVEFDLDLALEQSDQNPVYYIHNAHVRCAGILRKWSEAGYPLPQTADLSLLTHENELAFLRKANQLSEVIELVATLYEPHRLAFYAYDLAAAFHQVYESCRVLHPEVPEALRLARIQFYRAAKALLARVLRLMGMSTLESM